MENHIGALTTLCYLEQDDKLLMLHRVKKKIGSLKLWPGDRVFFKLLAQEHPFFSLKLLYDGDVLEECMLNGKRLEWEEFLGEDDKIYCRRKTVL